MTFFGSLLPLNGDRNIQVVNREDLMYCIFQNRKRLSKFFSWTYFVRRPQRVNDFFPGIYIYLALTAENTLSGMCGRPVCLFVELAFSGVNVDLFHFKEFPSLDDIT